MSLSAIHMMKTHRARFREVVTALDEQTLYAIPSGFRNHIAWITGHVVVTQQLLHYAQCGLPLHLDDHLVGMLRKGSSPLEWTGRPDWNLVLQSLATLPDVLEADYTAGRLADYQAYTTLSGVVLHDIDEAIAFNNIHEGIHLGVILARLKFQ